MNTNPAEAYTRITQYHDRIVSMLNEAGGLPMPAGLGSVLSDLFYAGAAASSNLYCKALSHPDQAQELIGNLSDDLQAYVGQSIQQTVMNIMKNGPAK